MRGPPLRGLWAASWGGGGSAPCATQGQTLLKGWVHTTTKSPVPEVFGSPSQRLASVSWVSTALKAAPPCSPAAFSSHTLPAHLSPACLDKEQSSHLTLLRMPHTSQGGSVAPGSQLDERSRLRHLLRVRGWEDTGYGYVHDSLAQFCIELPEISC